MRMLYWRRRRRERGEERRAIDILLKLKWIPDLDTFAWFRLICVPTWRVWSVIRWDIFKSSRWQLAAAVRTVGIIITGRYTLFRIRPSSLLSTGRVFFGLIIIKSTSENAKYIMTGTRGCRNLYAEPSRNISHVFQLIRSIRIMVGAERNHATSGLLSFWWCCLWVLLSLPVLFTLGVVFMAT